MLSIYNKIKINVVDIVDKTANNKRKLEFFYKLKININLHINNYI